MSRLSIILILSVAAGWAFVPAPAYAQSVSGCRPGTDALGSIKWVRHDENHQSFTGTPDLPVRIDCDDAQFFANGIEVFNLEDRLVATGDVLFVSGTNRISAERLEFNTKTKTGTFYNASGTAVIRDRSQPGPYGSQEPNAYFWGEEIRKTGP